MYRTGDLARWRAEGVLEFIGQATAAQDPRFPDFNRRAEAVLTSHPAVAQAVVVGREQEPAEKQLAGDMLILVPHFQFCNSWTLNTLASYLRLPATIPDLANRLPSAPCGQAGSGQ
jgi:hypothetical protein